MRQIVFCIWTDTFVVLGGSMEISYEALREEVTDFLDKHKIFVLATYADNRVTARSMSCVNKGLIIYFQTDTRFLKFKQIEQNPHVALCAGNVQIEGIAKIKKHPLDPSNQEFIELYKQHHLGSFKNYSHLKHNVVIEVEPTLITLWKYEENKPYREFLYVHEERAEREYYDISHSVR